METRIKEESHSRGEYSMQTKKGNMHSEDEKGKLFVGGLSWETTQDSLRRCFSRFGDVVDCVVMKNPETGRSRGFGFVTFADPNNIDMVLCSGPIVLDGRTVDPKACNPRAMQTKLRGCNFPKVFLGGLPSNVTETSLMDFFGRYGKVMEVVIMYDQEKKKTRGFGFLSFKTDESVDRCVAERYVTINGKQVEIKKAEPRGDSIKKENEGEPDGQIQMNTDQQNNWGMPQNMGPPGMNQGPPGSMGPPGMMQGPPAYQGWGSNPNPPQGYPGWGPHGWGPQGQPCPMPNQMGPVPPNQMGAPMGGWGYGPQGQWGYGPNYGNWNWGPGYGPPMQGPQAGPQPPPPQNQGGGPQQRPVSPRDGYKQMNGTHGHNDVQAHQNQNKNMGPPNMDYRGYPNQYGPMPAYPQGNYGPGPMGPPGYGMGPPGPGMYPPQGGMPNYGPTPQPPMGYGGPPVDNGPQQMEQSSQGGPSGPGPQRLGSYGQPQQAQSFHPYRRT